MLNSHIPMPGTRHRRVVAPLRTCLALVSMWGCFADTPTVNDDPSSHLRVVHAVPNGPAVNLVIDSTPGLQGLAFGTVTGFLAVEAGERRVRLMTTGASPTAILDDTVTLDFPRAYTLLSTGLIGNVEGVFAADTAPIPLSGNIALRVIHASPGAGDVDIYVGAPGSALSGTPMLEDLVFRGNSEYFAYPTGRYRIRLTAAGTTNVLLDQTILFPERAMRTIVVIDAVGGGLPINGLLLVDY